MIHKTYTAYKDCEYLVNASWHVGKVFAIYNHYILQLYKGCITSQTSPTSQNTLGDFTSS